MPPLQKDGDTRTRAVDRRCVARTSLHFPRRRRAYGKDGNAVFVPLKKQRASRTFFPEPSQRNNRRPQKDGGKSQQLPAGDSISQECARSIWRLPAGPPKISCSPHL